MAIELWQTLTCDCGQPLVVQLLTLRHKPGGGTTPQAEGYACWECGKRMDVAHMIALADLKRKRKELVDSQAQVDAIAATLG